MSNDYIGIKILTKDKMTTCIGFIRKIEPLSISEIKRRIENDECVLTYDFYDDKGLSTLINCYKELDKQGIKCELYENETLETLELFINRRNTYREIAIEVEDEMDYEASLEELEEHNNSVCEECGSPMKMYLESGCLIYECTSCGNEIIGLSFIFNSNPIAKSSDDFFKVFNQADEGTTFEIFIEDVKNTYLITKHKDCVSFSRTSRYGEESSEFPYESIYQLFLVELLDGVEMKTVWQYITKIIVNGEYSYEEYLKRL